MGALILTWVAPQRVGILLFASWKRKVNHFGIQPVCGVCKTSGPLLEAPLLANIMHWSVRRETLNSGNFHSSSLRVRASGFENFRV